MSARERAVRESVVLPGIFLTVVLASSLRVSAAGGTWSFEVPGLVFFGIAMLVVSLLARSGALAPDRLMHASRTPLENLSGAVVLATLFVASAQLLAALTPERGLLRLLFVVGFFVLLSNTHVLAPDGTRARRSLLLVLMSALMLKFVVLAAMFEPEAGFAKRLLTLLLEGVTLGGIDHVPSAPVTGYIIFAAVLVYTAGLVLLPGAPPSAPDRGALQRRPPAE